MKTLSRIAMTGALALAFGLSGCKQQDAAILVTIQGPFIIPTNADKLILDCTENGTVLLRKTFTLTAATPLPQTVTYVEGPGDHPHVKFNALLYKTDTLVGRGTVEADFTAGKTANVTVDVTTQ